MRAIYEWPEFAPFIQAALGEQHFYPYADPLADVIVNLAEAGNGFPWHFDTNNYTVTLAIQDSPRWDQAFSGDAGVTWESNWTMQFHRQPYAETP